MLDLLGLPQWKFGKIVWEEAFFLVGVGSFSTLMCCHVVLSGWSLGSIVVIKGYFRDLLLLMKPFLSVP